MYRGALGLLEPVNGRLLLADSLPATRCEPGTRCLSLPALYQPPTATPPLLPLSVAPGLPAVVVVDVPAGRPPAALARIPWWVWGLGLLGLVAWFGRGRGL